MDGASSGGETALMESVSQMSENGETPAKAEGNPTSQQNDLTELEEPKLSTDQFYPSLDPAFTTKDEKETIEKINSSNLPALPLSPSADVNASVSEQSEAQKEISSSDGEVKSVHFEAERQAEPIKQSEETTDQPNSSESLSGPNTPHDGQQREDNPKDVFSTQVDEETLAAAQQRQAQQGKLFSTEEWGPSRPPSVSLHQVVNNKVNEHYKAGLKHLEAQHYERAITSFSKAINLRSNQTIFYVKRAECCLQLCDFQSAILNYKRVCVLEPNNFEHYSRLAFIYFFQGQCLFDQKLYPEALESFSRAAEMRPEVIGYHTRSIACLAALERHGECLALVNKRLEADTGNADLYIMRARLHELFKNTTLCYYDVKDALALEPENPEALEMMERLKVKAKEMKQQAVQLNLVHRHRDALQKISMAIETDPSQPDYHITRGALQRRIGDYNAAIDDYLLAMDKTDHDEESATYIDAQRQLLLTYNDFAVECFTKGFYEEAVILLNKAIKGEKNEKGLYINRGDCFFRQGNFQFALADYQQALEIDGRDDAIHSRVAVIHNEYGVQDYQDKNYQDAESRFTLAIQHCPKMAQYYISRCRARQVMENISGARQDLLMAMHLDPSSHEITSLMTRLFPGKTVKDVLRSDAAAGIRQAFENLTIISSPVRLAPLDEESREVTSPERTFSARAKQEMTDSFDISSTWKPGYTFPSLKACMVERDFNIKIVSGKKRINNQIKNKLHNRKSLNQDGSRILPLSEPVQYTQVGGRAFHTEKMTVNAINDSGPNKKSTGWKTFSLGIGLNGIPEKL